jgi:hypothetical protein
MLGVVRPSIAALFYNMAIFPNSVAVDLPVLEGVPDEILTIG